MSETETNVAFMAGVLGLVAVPVLSGVRSNRRKLDIGQGTIVSVLAMLLYGVIAYVLATLVVDIYRSSSSVIWSDP